MTTVIWFPDGTATVGEFMKRRRKTRGMIVLLIVILALFLAVLGVVTYKEQEYKAGADYYDSLRLGDER